MSTLRWSRGFHNHPTDDNERDLRETILENDEPSPHLGCPSPPCSTTRRRPRLRGSIDAQPEDADGELDQFARRRCFNLSSGTSTLPGQPD